ncbi:hypothetical protein CBER1_05374 [Cercospora berteroae]|uniref:Uncharacterized protein n=1 Tax=Cercospora berteroae TaxID=357750 RepID=A0A2S6C760_9PEZI|nr:hypothetical protein CBER1_05374 [Cercospora berteroae]
MDIETPPSPHSPPPRFSVSEATTPRFTEHIHDSPPYQQYQNFDAQDNGVPRYGSDAGTLVDGRLSKKDRPYSPSELDDMPMAETYRNKNDESEKEVVVPPIAPEAFPQQADNTIRPQRRRICGIPAILFWLILAAIIILGIALGVGLGVGLNQDDEDDDSSRSPDVNATFLIGGAIDPEYYSSEGAFNGSGIALASQSFSRELQEGTQGTLVMYYQHYNGDIRFKQLANDGSWKGGDFSAVVAQDAKNSTPLSAVSYVLNNASTWHVFYIDQNNTLKQRSNSNTTNVWTDGPINNLNLQVYDADMVGMQACWYGSEYGDSDYAHSPLPNEDPSANRSAEAGMHMWYASDATTFQQLGWRNGDDTWEHQFTWDSKNGHAGVGCYSWGPGTVTYVMFVNEQNAAEFWWKDTNTNVTNTTSHPVNVWTKSSIAIDNVHPATSLGYTNYLYAQDADSLLFKGYNISWTAENSSIVGEPFEVQGDPGLPGTHLSVSALPNASGGSDIVVFYQKEGDDITVHQRDLVAGPWTAAQIPFLH